MHPGGEQAGAVQGTLNRGGGLVRYLGGEPDELPERGAGTGVASGRAQVTGGGRVVLLGRDRVTLCAQVRQAPTGLAQGRREVRLGGDGRGLPVGGAAVVRLGQADRARFAGALEHLRQGVDVGCGDQVIGKLGSVDGKGGFVSWPGCVGGGRPAGGPGGQGLGRLGLGGGEPGGGGVGVVLLALVGRDLAGQFLFGVGAFGLGVADRLEEAADLADVVAAGGHPGAGGRDELVAGVDRAEAVVGDAGPLGGVGQGGGDPIRLGAATGDACGELADGGGLVREPTAVPVEAVALAGDLGGAGGHLPALVLDPALGLVLLGVLEPG